MSSSDHVVVTLGCGPVLDIIAGDLLPGVAASARSCSGRFDFTGWTLTFEMRGPVVVTGSAAGDALGNLTYAWASGNTDFPGEYELIFRGVSPTPESKTRTFVVSGTVRIATV